MENTTRTVTRVDLDAFQGAALKFSSESLRLQDLMRKAVATLIAAVDADEDNFDDALEACQCAEAMIEKQYEGVLLEYERHAANFLGKGRNKGETLEEFVVRAGTMSEAELLLTPIRNGLRLRLEERG